MHYEQNTDRDGLSTIALVHNEEVLVWSVSKLTRPTVDLDVVTRDINEYWATMDDEVLDKLWGIYKEIHNCLCSNLDGKELATVLKSYIATLYDLMPYTPLEDWVKEHSTVKVPDDQLETEYTINAPNNQLTYLRHEYMQLLALATYLRPMIGIFGKYVQYVDSIVGTEFKEMSALYLLESSDVVDTEPYLRLLQYVTAIRSSKETPMDAVLKGLGSEEMPMWLLGFAIVRRLPFSELPDKESENDAHNLVSNIYNYIDAKVKQDKKAFGNITREKKLRKRDEQKGGTDNSPSVAENYKMTEEVSEGDVIDADYGMRARIDVHCDSEYSLQNSNVRRIVHRIDATVPDALIQLTEEFYLNRLVPDLAASNQHLEKFVLNTEVSRMLIPLISENVQQASIITLILLWHWKLYDLAALATGERKKIPSSVFVGSTKLKLEPDQIDMLNVIYPVTVNVRIASGRRTVVANQGQITVDELTTFFSSYGWQIRVPPKLRAQTTFNKNPYGLVVPNSIKQQLADMLIQLHEIGKL